MVCGRLELTESRYQLLSPAKCGKASQPGDESQPKALHKSGGVTVEE